MFWNYFITQWIHVVLKDTVLKDVAIKMNLLMERILNEQNDMYE